MACTVIKSSDLFSTRAIFPLIVEIGFPTSAANFGVTNLKTLLADLQWQARTTWHTTTENFNLLYHVTRVLGSAFVCENYIYIKKTTNTPNNSSV